MKRKIIKIDEEKCTGCGLCVPDCPEGALQIIDHKARLISDLFCDGLGACLGTCPEGAISVEEREAEPYDERKVMENIVRQGPAVTRAHLDHLAGHGETELLEQAEAYLAEKGIPLPTKVVEEKQACGCPGAATRDMRHPENRETSKHGASQAVSETGSPALRSHLQNWPVQLQLLNPNAPYLENADLLVTADCVPFAFGDFHKRFLQGKILLTFCPKLDKITEQYIEKLTAIFKTKNIKSISVVHMEVPCCSGTLTIVEQALLKAQKVMPIKEYTISISGEII